MSCDHLRNAVQKFLNFPDPEAEVERDRITEIAVKKLINKYLAGKVPTNECLERLE